MNYSSFGSLNVSKKLESKTDLSLEDSYFFFRIGFTIEPRALCQIFILILNIPIIRSWNKGLIDIANLGISFDFYKRAYDTNLEKGLKSDSSLKYCQILAISSFFIAVLAVIRIIALLANWLNSLLNYL